MTKPVVDGLEKDLRGQAIVLRLDLLSGVGRAAARQYRVKSVPATLLFDGRGQVVLRQVGPVNARAIRAKAVELAANR